MKILAIIPARGGSKRLKDKNMCQIMGRPSLAWAIDACRESRYDMDVVVSSEDSNILSVAAEHGAFPLMRPMELSDDSVDKQDVIRHVCIALDEGSYDVVISLQANSPEIRGFMLDAGIDLLRIHDLWEVASVDRDGVQNAAFRIMRYDYARSWKSVSSHFGVVIYDLVDIHTNDDVTLVHERWHRWHTPIS